MAIVKTLAVRVDQSPMNKLQWLMHLKCGHGIWVTQKTRPKVPQEIICVVCSKGIK